MSKRIDLAKKIAKELEKNWLPEITDLNLHTIFTPLYKLNYSIINANTIVSFIIMSYDYESNWIDLKRDREENKMDILKGLGADPTEEIFQEIISLSSTQIQNIISEYLKIQTDWRFRTIITCFDFHSKHIKSATEPLSAALTDDLEIAKINKTKSELLQSAIKQREIGESLLTEIKKDYVKLDRVTETEFGFSATDVERVDIMSWRTFIRQIRKQS